AAAVVPLLLLCLLRPAQDLCIVLFFFQAEDGIRDRNVTGVQTCALPILASKQHGKFKQTDATVGSFDAGYGSALLARHVGQKRAREIFFTAREYSADQMLEMGAINESVDHETLETVA